MHTGKLVFAQLMEHLPLTTFRRCVARYAGHHKIKRFTCLDQYLSMAFAQLTFRESLRDIEACLRAQSSKLYHLGFRSAVARNTLANANATRDWRIYCDFAQRLIAMARRLYANEPFGVDLKETVYALDAATIDLCLSVFPWAPFRSTKAAIKLHTLLDLRGSIPSFIHISDGKYHEINLLDELIVEPGAFYVMDRGYIDFERLFRLSDAGSFFVTRAKSNLKVQRRYSRKVDKTTGLICDQTVVLTVFYSRKGFDAPLRRVKFKDPRDGEKPGFSDQQFRPARAHDYPTLPLALANRVVFQVDQTTSSYQSVLRHHRKRRQNSNLDRDLRLRARGHHQKTAQPISQSLRTSTDLEPNLVRKNSTYSITCRFRPSHRFARSTQTIESIQLTLGHY
jgi:Domain of unknown function (DUF4372)/Transposase DDE domain